VQEASVGARIVLLGIVHANLIPGPGVTIQLFGQSEGNDLLGESGV
jgi:hypothetical protein